MRYTAVWLVGLMTLVIGFMPANVRADYISWQYNWSRSPGILYADVPSKGYITLTDESLKSAAGSSDIVATNIRVYSTASPAKPATFTHKGYTLTLFLLDEESGKSGTMNFTGEFNGTVSKLSSRLDNTFTSSTTQELLLGNNLYTVTIGPYAPPGPPSATNAGAVSAFAQVSVRNIQKTPEPSTLVLAGIALPALGLVYLRKRWQLHRT